MDLIKREHVTITVTPEFEHLAIRDSFDSGDAEFDEALAVRLEARLKEGDIWAWCCVAVKVDFVLLSGGTLLTSTHYLGGCSYDSEEDFKYQTWIIDGKTTQNAGYYHDLVDEGIVELNAALLEILGAVAALRDIN